MGFAIGQNECPLYEYSYSQLLHVPVFVTVKFCEVRTISPVRTKKRTVDGIFFADSSAAVLHRVAGAKRVRPIQLTDIRA